MNENIVESLRAVHQTALAEKLLQLTGSERELLEADIRTQDFQKLKQLFEENTRANAATDSKAEPSEASARSNDLQDIRPMPLAHSENDLRREMWNETGRILMKRGQIAAWTLAGGQGSRLGYEGPKGAYVFGLPSGMSLFALQAKRLLRLSAEAERPIPWCIMTSPLNHHATVEHFKENAYFGLNPDFVRFFEQGTICALDPKGDAIVTPENRLMTVPDGNGGCFRALAQSGSLAWLLELSVRFVFLCNIDNALVRIADPIFMGALASGQSQAIAKAVSKRNAEERVGIFAYKNNKPTVIEYTDMPQELRDMQTSEGELVFDGANIGIYAFRIEALKKMQSTPLPWHVARKTVCGIPNALKFEQFLFDAFPGLSSFTTFGTLRDEEFAPIKNAEGNDSPQEAKMMLGKLHRHWLLDAGVKLLDDSLYEISPALSYAGEGLSETIFKRELGKHILPF